MPDRVRPIPAVKAAVQVRARHSVERGKENFHRVRGSRALLGWYAIKLAAIARGEHNSLIENSALAQFFRCRNCLLGAERHAFANLNRRRVMAAPDERNVNFSRAGASRVGKRWHAS